MSALPKQSLTVDEFLAWGEGEPGRYELVQGHVVSMAPERISHARVKSALYRALWRGVEQSGLQCEVFQDGMIVRIDANTAFGPDASVHCGPRLSGDVFALDAPLIVAEVLSDSTRAMDVSRKLTGYFSLPSVKHYLILEQRRGPVIHHRREDDGTISTRIIPGGDIHLDPPGIVLSVDDLYADPS